MLLKSIRLCNIRSYENAEINFPSGSVLLAGDIGAGKSTILLAIEFAIFGAKKGELPAYTLLRHGKKEGYVELKMNVDGKDVIIKRTLKRSNEDIRQESGYVVMNGLKREGTSEELRAVVLELLGYPKDLIKKGKDLIYRYTVYTPQEEMKNILYESKENRLDTLRKVFSIDKYKRVKENSKIIISSLRERKRYLEGFMLDFDYKKKDLEEKRKEVLEVDKGMNELAPKIDEVRSRISGKRKSIEDIENEIKELNSLKSEMGIADARLNSSIEQYNKLNHYMERLALQIDYLKKELENKSLDDFEDMLKKTDEKEREMSEAERRYRESLRAIKGLEAKIEQCRDTMRKMESLEICPVCEQKVDGKHKHDISLRENMKHEGLLEQIKTCQEEEGKLEKVMTQLKKDIDLLMKEQNHFNVLKIKFENLSEKTGQRDEKLELKEKIKKEIGMLNARKAELSSKIQAYSETEHRYKMIKGEIDELLPQERFLELEKRKYETEKESIKRLILSLEKEIAEKQKAREKLAYLSQLGSWIDELFIRLMSAMEKHVMASIHSQFNELFNAWFGILMEDEAIGVKVDEEFTPIIEQDGYETYIENLSGGERTSVALSYRLALNKVINDIVADIKTKDIIMLDEPTDGFSSEQLDKVRDVLNQLGMKQVIIVSHESKIESFVENVIRVNKQDSVSVVD
jgi:exonuclease SbcC